MLSALSTGADGVSGLPDRKELLYERQLHRHSSEQIKHAESLPQGQRTYQSKVWIDGFSGNGLTSQRMLSDWSNYFYLGQVSPAYDAINRHTTKRLRQWLCRKHQVKTKKHMRFCQERLWMEHGLVRLSLRLRHRLKVKAVGKSKPFNLKLNASAHDSPLS